MRCVILEMRIEIEIQRAVLKDSRGCEPICRNTVRDNHVECIDIEN